MRLFLLAVGLGLLAGCQQASAGAGAVRVELFYATFRPGCLRVTATDMADPSRTQTQQLTVAEGRSGRRTVAVFRKPDWSRALQVTAEAREGSCDGPPVATSTQQVDIPERGATVAYLDLRAEDLDGDGFVATRNGGTDCDDTRASVYPGATEVCDGVDNNCVNGEADATDMREYYADADGDGYGNSVRSAGRACVAPPGMTFVGGDCDDTHPAVHPGQAETRCDGEDENCDGVPDDTFRIGQSCTTEQRCAGTWECNTRDETAVCSSKEPPRTWYVDADGDSLPGTALPGETCEQPAGAFADHRDCDDRSRFRGGHEVCDRLDNNCDGAVDEFPVCAGFTWSSMTVGGSTSWTAVTTYAEGKAWLAGAGNTLSHVERLTETDRSGACGGTRDWTAAWARPSDGRVFLGSAQGRLATVPVAGASCIEGLPSDAGGMGDVTGLVGFERDAVTRVYAVTRSGHVLRWEWRDDASVPPPQVVVRLAANLNGVHGLSPDALLVVGAEKFQPGVTLPRAFRVDGVTGRWARETLPAGLGMGELRGVNVVEPWLSYVVGDRGWVLKRENGAWSWLPSPGSAAQELVDVVAFAPTVVLVLAHGSTPAIHRLNGTAWVENHSTGQPLLSLDAVVSHQQWGAGRGGTLVRWGRFF